MSARTKNRIINVCLSAGAIVCMWAVWLIACAVVNDGYVIPSFPDTAERFFALLGSGGFWLSFAKSLGRTALSWAVSLLAAAALAFACAAFPRARAFAAPFVAVFRTVPTMAITLMLLIWSSPRVAPVIVGFLMLFPITYSQMMAAVDGMDAGLAQMADVYGISAGERLFKIYIPQILPPVLAQVGANFSLTLKVIISAEVMCSTFDSLGGMIHQSNVFLDTAQMFALTICALLAGGLLQWALSKLALITRRRGGSA